MNFTIAVALFSFTKQNGEAKKKSVFNLNIVFLHKHTLTHYRLVVKTNNSCASYINVYDFSMNEIPTVCAIVFSP